MSGFSLRARLGTIGAVAIVVGLAGAAYGDARSFDGRVLRNVTIGGRNVGGLDTAGLEKAIDSVEETMRAAPVRIATPSGGFSFPGASFGLTVDRPRLRAAAMAAGREPSLGHRLRRYVAAFSTPLDIAVPVMISKDKTVSVLQEGEGPRRRDPVDPKLKVRNGSFTILPGSDGEGIDARVVADTIESEVAAGRFPVTVAATSVALPSKYTTEELAALSARATALTARAIEVTANGSTYTISTDSLRDWVRPSIVNRQVRLTLDPDETLAGLRKIFGGEVVRPARNAQLLIGSTGEVVTLASEQGLRCCAASTYQRLEAVFAGSASPPVSLDLDVIEPKLTTEEVSTLGVTEQISTFTTRHRAGEDRVKNIHRIADLLRGTVIKPGDTFSVNETIGPRTPAKGFIEAHVIEDGVFKDSFGGGISQFATTLFNASFFAGLDIPAYKAHSIYISRYPYGREATLSFPRPDLKIRNTTPYGVMIWPTYNDSSLTVTLYSTKFATGEVAEQKKTERGQCADVETTRRVTRIDGTSKTDTFRAVYLPKEGVNCNGEPTPGATTTTLKPRETIAPSEPDTTDGATEPTPASRVPVSKPSSSAPADPPPSSKKPTVTTTPPEPPPSSGAVPVGAPVTNVAA
jgi:vancomycin resistance protein YoaR